MEAQGMAFPPVARYSPGGDFGRWLREVDRYMAAVGIQDSNRKSAVLLHLIGPDVADLVDTLPEETDATAEADDYDKLKKKLTAYLSPVRNTVAERSAFHQMRMEASEDLEHFLGRLRAQIALCSYPATETDTELRDQCVLGCRAGLQEKLVQLAASKGDKLTLEEVRQAGRAHRDLQQLGAQLAATRVTERPAAVGDQPPYPPEPHSVDAVAAGGRTLAGQRRRADGERSAVGRDTLIPGLQLRPSPLHLTSFTGHVIPLIGEGQVSVRFRGRDHRLRLVVVDLPGERRLLGRDWMSALNISASGEAAVLTVGPGGVAADLQAREEKLRQWQAGRPGHNRQFSIGDHVWTRAYGGPSKWRRGVITARTGPLSFEVDVGSAIWSRHADQLRHAGAPRDPDTPAEPSAVPGPGAVGRPGATHGDGIVSGRGAASGPDAVGGTGQRQRFGSGQEPGHGPGQQRHEQRPGTGAAGGSGAASSPDTGTVPVSSGTGSDPVPASGTCTPGRSPADGRPGTDAGSSADTTGRPETDGSPDSPRVGEDRDRQLGTGNGASAADQPVTAGTQAVNAGAGTSTRGGRRSGRRRKATRRLITEL
ncbi:hypothetical protein FJT64_006790 [Amphibalanus amphitrite]|uniref:Retrotransposon gag domain-containing protein n=1 Tax=Amphibalanus amphitrite TaxID=1232801 RepID=A0A6A4VPW0_AMPAM|nr:hypothetical protein FJT64_006790 [Amphibalanus amphitrite]